jgi:hypothetical protein
MWLKVLLLISSWFFLFFCVQNDKTLTKQLTAIDNIPTFPCTATYIIYENDDHIFVVIKNDNMTQCYIWDGVTTSCIFLEYDNLISINMTAKTKCYMQNKKMKAVTLERRVLSFSRFINKITIYFAIAIVVIVLSSFVMC